MRESFLFYRSFYEAFSKLSNKNRLKMYDSIAEFALNDKELVLNGECERLFITIKPQIIANNKKYENGKKGAKYGKLGGRPKKEITPMGLLSKTPNVNDNENVNNNVNVNDNSLSHDNDDFLEKERENFYKFLKKQYNAENPQAYISTIKRNGDYPSLLKEYGEYKAKLQEKNPKKDIKSDLLRVTDKYSAAIFIGNYGDPFVEHNHPKEVLEVIEKYGFGEWDEIVEYLYKERSKRANKQ